MTAPTSDTTLMPLLAEHEVLQQRVLEAWAVGRGQGIAGGDEALLASWVEFQAALREGLASDDEDDPAWSRLGRVDNVIHETPATTLGGAKAKLLRALVLVATEGWIEKAVAGGDDDMIFARARELDYEARLIVDAISAITGPMRRRVENVEALARWDAAETALAQADADLAALGPCYEDEEVDRLADIRGDAIDAIIALPATTPAQAIRKLELGMFDEESTLSTVDYPALLAEAKRVVGVE